MKRLPTLFLFTVAPGHAALTLIPPVTMGEAAIDPDGDGTAEFSNFALLEGQLHFALRVDGVATPIQFPDADFVGVNVDSFKSASGLVSSSIFSGDFTAQSDLTRLFDNIGGSGLIRSIEPIWAGWVYGTSGSGAETVHLIGIVIDASDLFNSGGTADLKVYHHDYGDFAPGQSLPNASLSATGYPPATSTESLTERGLLPSTTEFDGPRKGSILVSTSVGRTYRLMRGSRPGDGGAILTRTGTGAIEAFPWDDSTSTDSSAFFWVEETQD